MAERVLVLGGGLAGVACARRLGDEGIDVTLVDRNDYHQFQPLLYQVASSQLPAEDIARPHQTIFRKHPTVDVLNAHASQVDLSSRSLTLDDGTTLHGSHLVVAAGARPNFFGVPGAAEHSFPLYSVADAERLRLHLQRLLQAATADEATAQPGQLDVVVVGGGPTGVETTGALAELMQALHKTGRLAQPGQITLVDRGNALLAQFSSKAHGYATRKLVEAGAAVRLGVGVAAVTPDGVVFDDGTEIATRTVVWGGGESGATVAQAAARSRAAEGASMSRRTCRSPATRVATWSATWPTSRTPRRRAPRCPSWGRWRSSRGNGPRRTSCEACREPRRRPSSTRTRG